MRASTTQGPTGGYPEHVAVIGGGRWARVILDVLTSFLPDSVRLSAHSRSNAAAISAWAEQRGLDGRLEVFSEWPQPINNGARAAIIANGAAEHCAAAEWSLSRQFAVLIEKPVALNSALAARLVQVARINRVPVAAAHVFLFAEYLRCFRDALANVGPIEALKINWSDAAEEQRYSETKRYDPTLPLFADCLPHIVSLAHGLLGRPMDSLYDLAVHRGGAAVHLRLSAGAIVCDAFIERNSPRRQRSIRAICRSGSMDLDFTAEPGTIHYGASLFSGDPEWNSRMRPMARMTSAFLRAAAGGHWDERLDIELGVRACELIDKAWPAYRIGMSNWFVDRLSAAPDDEICYALTELALEGGSISSSAVAKRVSSVCQRLRGPERTSLLETLARDPVRSLKRLLFDAREEC